MSGMMRRDAIKRTQGEPEAPRDEIAARIVHRLTCTRCRMDWPCGGLGEDDYERSADIADLLAEVRRD